MSVAKCLGVNDIDAPNMRELRAEWPHWCQMIPALPPVSDLAHLPRWMQGAEPGQRDAVLTVLWRIAETDRRAYVVLAWLLMPGAARVAGRIRRLADEIDEVVAGQLWIQICDHDPNDDKYVAKKILDRVAKESMAELGVGDLAKRRDPTWAHAVLTDRFEESIPSVGPEPDAREELERLLRRALDSGVLTGADRDLLLDLAKAAQRAGVPLRRGRAGLTTPSVAEMVSDDHALAARSIRRHAADALDVLREEARHEGLAI